MPKTTKAAQKRVGRPQGRKPMLNLRIDQDLLDQIKSEAAASGRTTAEEVVRRLRESFVQEKQHAETLQFYVDQRDEMQDELGRAETRIEELETLSLNVAEVVKQAVAEAFESAGIKPKGE